jgi:hypothetical protein
MFELPIPIQRYCGNRSAWLACAADGLVFGHLLHGGFKATYAREPTPTDPGRQLRNGLVYERPPEARPGSGTGLLCETAGAGVGGLARFCRLGRSTIARC